MSKFGPISVKMSSFNQNLDKLFIKSDFIRLDVLNIYQIFVPCATN